jgi:hypothetical protein
MKKQILALMVCTAFLASTSGFCMQKDEDSSSSKSVTLKVAAEQSCAIDHKWSRLYVRLGYEYSFENPKAEDLEIRLGLHPLNYGESKTMALPLRYSTDQDTVKFYFTFFQYDDYCCNKGKVGPVRNINVFYKEEQGNSVSDVPLSSIPDGSTLELSIGKISSKEGSASTEDISTKWVGKLSIGVPRTKKSGLKLIQIDPIHTNHAPKRAGKDSYQ